MNQSEHIGELASALAKSQGAFTNPPRNREVKVKTRAGDTYTFNYATLDAIMEMVRKPLADNGLAIVHSLGNDDQGPICETRIVHSSGQWISTWVPVIVEEGANAQGWGGAITYARRYGLCSLLAIAADEDDDANAACGNEGRTGNRQQKPTNGHGKPNGQQSGESAARADAWRDLQEAENSRTVMTIVTKIENATIFSPDVKKDLLAYAAERMRDFAAKAVKNVQTIPECDKSADWFGSCRLFDAAEQQRNRQAFAATREVLASHQASGTAA